MLGRGEVDEAHAVLQLERRVAKSGRFAAPQVLVDRADELLVLRRPIGLDLVATMTRLIA
jgi:hypothetical protein